MRVPYLVHHRTVPRDGTTGIDLLPDCLLQMLKTAQAEIDRHVCDGTGMCCVCGTVFPCARARQADLALAGF